MGRREGDGRCFPPRLSGELHAGPGNPEPARLRDPPLPILCDPLPGWTFTPGSPGGPDSGLGVTERDFREKDLQRLGCLGRPLDGDRGRPAGPSLAHLPPTPGHAGRPGPHSRCLLPSGVKAGASLRVKEWCQGTASGTHQGLGAEGQDRAAQCPVKDRTQPWPRRKLRPAGGSDPAAVKASLMSSTGGAPWPPCPPR